MPRLTLYRLLRASRVRSEQGNVLVLALVATIVLTVGLAALASRTNLGVFGAIFQSRNREARDVAEAEISRFIDTMNQPENRYLLTGGNGHTWNGADTTLRNPCTQYSPANLTQTSTTSSDITAEAKTFQPGLGWQAAPGNAGAEYLVESVEYLTKDRVPYTSSDIGARGNIWEGSERGFVRVTLQARVTRNGRVSTSRVARELEVIPKCCWRSFGVGPGDAASWGRDTRYCDASQDGGGGAGIVVFKDVQDSNNVLDIRDETGGLILTALCWDGLPTDLSATFPSSLRSQTPNPDCGSATDPYKIGRSISLSPLLFNYLQPDARIATKGQLPTTTGALPSTTLAATDGWSQVSELDAAILNQTFFPASAGNWYQQGNTVWVAGYPKGATLGDPNIKIDDLVWYQVGSTTFSGGASSATPSATPGAIDLASTYNYIYYNKTAKEVRMGRIGGTETSLSSYCYTISSSTGAGIGPSPYAEVNCNLTGFINPPNSPSAKKVYIDSTNAKINLFFVGDGIRGEYFEGGGSTSYIHTHCTTSPSGSSFASPCTEPITLTKYRSVCTATSSGTSVANPNCSRSSITNRPYDTGELFNIYTLGTGSVTFNGGAEGLGFNLYAPYGTFSLLGGGSSAVNFLGRAWVALLDFKGGGTINTLSTRPAICGDTNCPDNGINIYDMKVRSYTHARAF